MDNLDHIYQTHTCIMKYIYIQIELAKIKKKIEYVHMWQSYYRQTDRQNNHKIDAQWLEEDSQY